jgi:outer membrane protein assembly factor BamB
MDPASGVGGKVLALDLDSRDELWSVETEQNPDTLTYVDGRLYVNIGGNENTHLALST